MKILFWVMFVAMVGILGVMYLASETPQGTNTPTQPAPASNIDGAIGNLGKK